MKIQNGITLITLILTIIVILILAGITISIFIENDGLIDKVSDVKKNTNVKQTEEKVDLIMKEWDIYNKVETSNFEDFLNAKVLNGEIDNWTNNEDNTYTLEINGYIGRVNKNGQVISELQVADLEVAELEDPVAIPVGSSKVLVKCNISDMSNISKIYYSINSGTTWNLGDTDLSKMYMYTGLNANTEYKIKIKAIYNNIKKVSNIITVKTSNSNENILYDYGNNFAEFVTPMPNRYEGGAWHTKLSAEFNSDYIKLWEQLHSSGWRQCGIITKNKIDLSQYTGFNVYYSVVTPNVGYKNGKYQNSFEFQASTNSAFNVYDSLNTVVYKTGINVTEIGEHVNVLDISKVSGSRYLGISLWTAIGDGYTYENWDADIRVKSIWLTR